MVDDAVCREYNMDLKRSGCAWCSTYLLAILLIGACDQPKPNLEIPWQRADLSIASDTSQTVLEPRQELVSAETPVRVGRAQFFEGGSLVLRPVQHNGAGERADIELNLVDATIAEAAGLIIGELLEKSYSINPNVTGNLTIRSEGLISLQTALQMFELALSQANAVMIEEEDFFAILPASQRLAVGIDVGRPVRRGFSIRAVPLRFVSARDMAEILKPMAAEGLLLADETRNVLILAGNSGDQIAWQEAIESFDVDWLSNRSIGVIPIQGQPAGLTIEALRQIFPTNDSASPEFMFETLASSNSVLIVARNPESLRNAAKWVRRVASQGQGVSPIFAYEMKYAQASAIAPLIGRLLGLPVDEAGVASTPTSAPAPAPLDQVDSDLGLLEELFATRLVASDEANMLLVYGPIEVQDRVKNLLFRLDVPPRQVLVEATIIEVSLNDTLRYGVQYFFEDKGIAVGLSAGTSTAIVPALPGLSFVVDTPANVVIDALEDVTSVNVISSPNLMVLNNQSARLSIGDQVPVATRQSSDGTQNDEIFVSEVEFRETGIIFEVTPRINSSGSVILDISQEVSQITEAEADTLTPTIQNRTLSSSIAVDSGETIVLGGLFSTRNSDGKSGLPLLKDLPFIGAAFGRTSISNAKTELLVLITPRIINNRQESRQVSQTLRRRLGIVSDTNEH